MARKVFFSFHYSRDCQRVNVVRNSNVIGSYDKSYYDRAGWEEVKKKGDQLGKGLLGVNISKIKNLKGEIEDSGTVNNPLPTGYTLYKWNNEDGAKNLGKWIEEAAIEADR